MMHHISDAVNASDVTYPALCYDLLEAFSFPVFEVLVTLQVRKKERRNKSICIQFPLV